MVQQPVVTTGQTLDGSVRSHSRSSRSWITLPLMVS